MSIHVEVNIADGVARRHLEINRLSMPTLDADGHRELDDVNDYEVTFTGGSSASWQEATFQHRYGDPEMVLVAKAIVALGFPTSGAMD